MTTARYSRNQLFQNRTFMTVRRPGVAGEIGTATFDIFNITGSPVLIAHIFGHVTTIIGAGPALPQIQFTPVGGGVLTPLCAAALDIANDAVNTLYGWDGLAASNLIVSAVIGAMGLIATSEWDGKFIFLVPGVISITDATAAATTGVVDWYITYLPLTINGVVTPA